METHIQAVGESVEKSLPKRRRRDNLTMQETEAINKVRKRAQAGAHEILIKSADKGSATFIMSWEDYVTEAMRQLNKEVPPCSAVAWLWWIAFNIAKWTKTPHLTAHHLAHPTSKDRQSIDARTAVFDLLPKIHKWGNPGRPILSLCGAPTEKISQLICGSPPTPTCWNPPFLSQRHMQQTSCWSCSPYQTTYLMTPYWLLYI